MVQKRGLGAKTSDSECNVVTPPSTESGKDSGTRAAHTLLTDAAIRKLPTEGRRSHAVGRVPGLMITVGKQASTFHLFYRHDGLRRRVTIGKFGPGLGVKAAREQAGKVLAKVRLGEDPATAKKGEREALRVSDLLAWYADEYSRVAGRLKTGKAESTIAADKSYCTHLREKHKRFMAKRVADVNVADLERVKAKCSAGAWSKIRNILRVILKRAEELGLRPHGSNPTAKVKSTPDRKVERYLSPEERRRLETALDHAEALGSTMRGTLRGTAGGLDPSYVRLFRLLMLTGMRRGEGLALDWSMVDWTRGELVLPTSKTGRKRVPLTKQALAFLESQRQDSGLVCPSTNGTALHPGNVMRAWKSVRTAAGLSDLRLHDLRHSWAADAVSAGVPLRIVGKVLGHAQVGTTARYGHLHDSALREGLERAGDAIEGK